jgi:hypothetical protein
MANFEDIRGLLNTLQKSKTPMFKMFESCLNLVKVKL